MVDKSCARGSKNIVDLFSWFLYKLRFPKINLNYFYPEGTVLFVGSQGSGKTLSAVKYVCELMELYPDSLLVTNVSITAYPVDNSRVFWFHDNDDFTRYSNGHAGVIYFVDEIQLYLNSLQSKNIDIAVMTQISQQRKQRKTIVCTSQRLNRVAKPLREQYPTVVDCVNIGGFLQVNKVIEHADVDDSGHTVGDVVHKYSFFHNPKDYDLYDTYSIITLNKANFKGGDYNAL